MDVVSLLHTLISATMLDRCLATWAIRLSASSEFQTKKRLVNNDHNPGFAWP
jgi:hypothetical protein